MDKRKLRKKLTCNLIKCILSFEIMKIPTGRAFSFQKEVIAALPKLIKLNPVVVKEVFNRLLGNSSKYRPEI